MKYKVAELSKYVGFFRKHHRIPEMDEVERAYQAALEGDLDSAVLLLSWRRHCFLPRSIQETAVMERVFELSKEIMQ